MQRTLVLVPLATHLAPSPDMCNDVHYSPVQQGSALEVEDGIDTCSVAAVAIEEARAGARSGAGGSS